MLQTPVNTTSKWRYFMPCNLICIICPGFECNLQFLPLKNLYFKNQCWKNVFYGNGSMHKYLLFRIWIWQSNSVALQGCRSVFVLSSQSYLPFLAGLGDLGRENQKFELLGIWREQWIKKLRLCVLLFHSNMHVFLLYRLDLWFLLVNFSKSLGQSFMRQKGWRVPSNVSNFYKSSEINVTNSVLWPAKLYRRAEDQTHPKQCSWTQRTWSLARPGKVCCMALNLKMQYWHVATAT